MKDLNLIPQDQAKPFLVSKLPDGLLDQVNQQIKALSDFQVFDPKSAEKVGEMIKPSSAIGKLKKEIETIRIELTSPLDQLKKDLIAAEKELIAPIEQVINELSGKRNTYMAQVREKEQAEARSKQARLDLIASIGPTLAKAYMPLMQAVPNLTIEEAQGKLKQAKAAKPKVPESFETVADQYREQSQAYLDSYIAALTQRIENKEVTNLPPDPSVIGAVQTLQAQAQTAIPETRLKGQTTVVKPVVKDWTKVDPVAFIRYLMASDAGLKALTAGLGALPKKAAIAGIEWEEEVKFTNR